MIRMVEISNLKTIDKYKCVFKLKSSTPKAFYLPIHFPFISVYKQFKITMPDQFGRPP